MTKRELIRLLEKLPVDEERDVCFVALEAIRKGADADLRNIKIPVEDGNNWIDLEIG